MQNGSVVVLLGAFCWMGKETRLVDVLGKRAAEASRNLTRPCVQELDSPLIWVRGLLFS